MKTRQIVILGSTGSIGRQALDVVSRDSSLSVCGLSAGTNWQLLAEQADRFRPQLLALADAEAAKALQGRLVGNIRVLGGPDAMSQLVRTCRPDVLLSGVVGAAGLKPTLAGIECGSTLAIANKETLVMAGEIVMPAARKAGVNVLPVDSEHSAIFQCLAAGRREEVRRVVITASGGALRDWDDRAAAKATAKDALNHPTWNMGRKITIDSATMMNKALEIIEAHWLFDLPAEQIEVILHPESIVHSYVEFRDGSVIAQMGMPDMTLPIAYALNYPNRADRPEVASLDLARLGRLHFAPLGERFRSAVNLAYQVIHRGGVTGAVLNSANEAAVEAFLAGKISFGEIVPLVEDILNRSQSIDEVTLKALSDADEWARGQVAGAVEK